MKRLLALLPLAAACGYVTFFEQAPQARGPVLVVEPPLIDLGKQPFLADLPLEFLVTNVGDQEAAFGPVQAECGCLEARVDVPLIAPGQSAILSAIQSVKSLGPQSYGLSLEVVNAPGLRVEARVSVDGVPTAMLVPEQLNLGLPEAPGRACSFRAAYMPGPGESDPPLVELRGEVAGEVRVGPGPSGSWILEGTARPAGSAPLGYVRGEIVAKSTAPPSETKRPILLELAPEGCPDWPSCRVSLPPYGARATRLELPETRIHSWLGDDSLVLAVEPGKRGDVLVIDAPAQAAPAGTIRGTDIELQTSRGMVRVHVTVPSPRATSIP